MNYQDPELQSRLASEYVLGTLRGRARKRFERLLNADANLRAHVNTWENRLAGLNQTARDVVPQPRVWKKIETRLFPEISPAAKSGVSAFWQWLGLGTTALSLMLGFYLFEPILNPPGKLAADSYLSVFQDDRQQAIWSVQIDGENGYLKIHSHNVPSITDSQDYQLWLLLPDDKSPVSLGLLPQNGQQSLPLQQLSYADATGIAVSLEPKGGSTTGLPTGPVLYVASLLDVASGS